MRFFQADEYTRDSVGRVTAVVDRVMRGVQATYGVREVAQCYEYDDANRLASAWTENALDVDRDDVCLSAPSSAADWNIDPTAFRASWSYGLAGQIDASTQEWVDGAAVASQDFDYVYHEDHPHAVQSTGVGEYEYDDAGRMISRDSDGAGGVAEQTLVWDAVSNLVGITTVTGTERYIYNASGQRVVRIADGEATAYLGSTEVTDPNVATSDSTMSVTRYYALGSTTVALRDDTGFSYLIGDVQGSASVLIPAGTTGDKDPDTVVASRNAYTPYGVTRGDDNLTTDRGWLGQVEDATSSLTYLNARYYDPATARFISPDPLMDPADPRTLDPYRYADNNPILYTDATGLNPGCGGMTGKERDKCYASYSAAQQSNASANVVDNAIKTLNKNSAKNGSGKTYTNKDVPGSHKSQTKPTALSTGGKSFPSRAAAPPPPSAGGCPLFTGSQIDDAGTVHCYKSYGSHGQGAWSVEAREEQERQGGPTLGEFAHELVIEGIPYFWKHHGDEVIRVASVAALAACVVASAGTCFAVGAAFVTVTTLDGLAYRSWDGKQATAYVVFSVVTLGIGGAAGAAAHEMGTAARITVVGGVDVPAIIGSEGIANGRP